jgi:hypothetical protein
MGFQSRSRSKKRKERILPCLSGSGVAIRHIVASEECNSQSAPIEENGESKKRKEKKAKPAGTEVKPIRKATLNLSDGGKLRRLLLTAHDAECGENLTASNLFPLSSIVWLSRFWTLVLERKTFLMSGLFRLCDLDTKAKRIPLMIRKSFDLLPDVRGCLTEGYRRLGVPADYHLPRRGFSRVAIALHLLYGNLLEGISFDEQLIAGISQRPYANEDPVAAVISSLLVEDDSPKEGTAILWEQVSCKPLLRQRNIALIAAVVQQTAALAMSLGHFGHTRLRNSAELARFRAYRLCLDATECWGETRSQKLESARKSIEQSTGLLGDLSPRKVPLFWSNWLHTEIEMETAMESIIVAFTPRSFVIVRGPATLASNWPRREGKRSRRSNVTFRTSETGDR